MFASPSSKPILRYGQCARWRPMRRYRATRAELAVARASGRSNHAPARGRDARSARRRSRPPRREPVEAKELLLRAAQAHPTHLVVQRTLAEVSEQLGEHTDAAEAWETTATLAGAPQHQVAGILQRRGALPRSGERSRARVARPWRPPPKSTSPTKTSSRGCKDLYLAAGDRERAGVAPREAAGGRERSQRAGRARNRARSHVRRDRRRTGAKTRAGIRARSEPRSRRRADRRSPISAPATKTGRAPSRRSSGWCA